MGRPKPDSGEEIRLLPPPDVSLFQILHRVIARVTYASDVIGMFPQFIKCISHVISVRPFELAWDF